MHIASEFLRSWGSIMTSAGSRSPQEIALLFTEVITQQENYALTGIPMPEDIWNIVIFLNPWQARSLDGFNDQFSKSSWAVIGQDVAQLGQTFFKEEVNLEALNKTIVAPLPECISAEDVTDFRPISLCNEVYKIIAKLLVARLKIVLTKYIGPEQSISIEGLWIMLSCLIMLQIYKTKEG